MVDKVHNHVCGHAVFTYKKLLLERNDFWNDTVASYVSELLQDFTAFRATAEPQPHLKVSISYLRKVFNEIVFIDHFS